MYLIFGLIGLIIAGLVEAWTAGPLLIGFAIGVIVGIIFKLFAKSGSAMDGCFLIILFDVFD